MRMDSARIKVFRLACLHKHTFVHVCFDSKLLFYKPSSKLTNYSIFDLY